MDSETTPEQQQQQQQEEKEEEKKEPSFNADLSSQSSPTLPQHAGDAHLDEKPTLELAQHSSNVELPEPRPSSPSLQTVAITTSTVEEPQQSQSTPESSPLESARPESARPESARPESASLESARPESPRPESARPQSSPSEAVRPESPRPEAERPESPRLGSARPLSSRPASSRAGSARPSSPLSSSAASSADAATAATGPVAPAASGNGGSSRSVPRTTPKTPLSNEISRRLSTDDVAAMLTENSTDATTTGGSQDDCEEPSEASVSDSDSEVSGQQPAPAIRADETPEESNRRLLLELGDARAYINLTRTNERILRERILALEDQICSAAVERNGGSKSVLGTVNNISSMTSLNSEAAAAGGATGADIMMKRRASLLRPRDTSSASAKTPISSSTTTGAAIGGSNMTGASAARGKRAADAEQQIVLEQCLEQLRRERRALQNEITELKSLFATREEEFNNEQATRVRIERELKDLRALHEQKVTDWKSKNEASIRVADELRKCEAQMLEIREAREAGDSEVADLMSKCRVLEENCAEYQFQIGKLEEDKRTLAQNAADAQDSNKGALSELMMLTRARDSYLRKMKKLDEQRHDLEVERDALRSANFSLERQVSALTKKGEEDKSQIESLVNEREVLSKNILKVSASASKHASIVKCHEISRQTLEQEILGYKDEAAKQRKLIFALEKERDRYVNEAAALTQARTAAEEEVIIRENHIFDYKKKIADAEYKLRQQQALYEQVRSDRNLYSKNLLESQEEIAEMQRKLKIMTHQIEQYKEEIAAKESALLKEHFEHQKVEKEKEATKQEVQKLRLQLETVHHFVQNQQAEENKLRHTIAESDSERQRQKKEYDSVIQERDLLGAQLIRRNDELALLYEKCKIQQSTLNKGEVQYRERVEDLRVLKLEIKRLRREKSILQRESFGIEKLKADICRLQRELLGEQTRVKVLEEELENPLNIHRWRKLAGADPAAFELMQKVQTLQKRLIRKTEQVVEKELLVVAKEKLYVELKAMLARVPGPEIIHQIEALKCQLKSRTREMKALASELTMHQSLSVDYKAEISSLTSNLQQLKRLCLAGRRSSTNSQRRMVGSGSASINNSGAFPLSGGSSNGGSFISGSRGGMRNL